MTLTKQEIDTALETVDGLALFAANHGVWTQPVPELVAVCNYLRELAVQLEPKPLNDPFDGAVSREIYLRKDGQLIGLHAIGYDDCVWTEVDLDGTEIECKGFMAMETWGNEYDELGNMLGRGSFRIFQTIESLALSMETDGWVRGEGPKPETKNA